MRFFKQKEIPSNPAEDRILKSLEASKKKTSVIFNTTHKCASTFISKFLNVIGECSDYNYYNYARAMTFMGDKMPYDKRHADFYPSYLEKNYEYFFKSRGELYGPMRFPIDFPNRENYKQIFFFRDPRDIVVSAFYSFGYSHGLPKNSFLKQDFIEMRERIQQEGIDSFAVHYAQEIHQRLVGFQKLHLKSNDSLVLKYSDYINEPGLFISQVLEYLDINLDKNQLIKLVELASPVQKEINSNSHKRSGKSGQFLNELKSSTIGQLEEVFCSDIEYWDLN